MKKKIRDIHIGNEIWKWVVEYMSPHNEIRIYSPEKKMTRIQENWLDKTVNEETVGDIGGSIRPGMIKKYIEDYLVD